MHSSTIPASRRLTSRRWRTVDIVVAAAIAVAGGVVFWGWSQLWTTTSGAFAAFPPAQGVMYGIWLAPGVIGGLVVRKPGAALFTELVASIVEALLGSAWGLSVIVYGLAEGAAPELVFALLWYRAWRLPVAVLAGAAAGLVAAGLDLVYYYGAWRASWQISYLVVVTLSSAAIAGVGGALLVRALARTGVLQPFASGRTAPGS
ncbi:MAG TPA: ECF transporter S component [Solirubrobacteraceae bacterium]|nr:ECF transporter S component [Solirubrobacteraceae bacterium]